MTDQVQSTELPELRQAVVAVYRGAHHIVRSMGLTDREQVALLHQLSERLAGDLVGPWTSTGPAGTWACMPHPIAESTRVLCTQAVNSG